MKENTRIKATDAIMLEQERKMRGKKVYFLYLGQDDPKKSTMKKLQRLNLAQQTDKKRCGKCIVITPYAERYLTKNDAYLFEKIGICVIDGSWNRIESIRELRYTNERILPLLVPANPVNFGKTGKLGSAEAISASLFIMGFPEDASLIMSKFKWGPTFIEMNRELLKDYAECSSREDILEVQDAYF